ncbi:insulin-like growth factor II isoform X3 [Maniola jurtina]|uniref:insulin-like growth factor II isoform X3 n=1 Tax=Maniola jurtina TaxID=191418 RepID=UPI001E68DCEE|nr:insulin-like growth factor II isoform X3 [Maniola jurtina]
MLVNKIVHLAIVVLTIVWDLRCDAATAAVKLCGRELSDFMSRVCHAYNSPSWDVPTVIEQPAAVVRRKRRTGIADECCVFGCTWEQLSSYCAISAKSESPVDSMEAHLIADRSAEAAAAAGAAVVSPAVLGKAEASTRREGLIKNAARAAPVLGTVSPLLTWGRTLNTDLPSIERDRYAYIAVYT